jgi:hypothetical protein
MGSRHLLNAKEATERPRESCGKDFEMSGPREGYTCSFRFVANAVDG